MAKPTITRERLEQLADNNTICKVSWDERIELAQIVLAAMDSEPVAEVVSIYGDPEAFGEREIRPLVGIQQMPYGTKLYRHAQPVAVAENGLSPALSLTQMQLDWICNTCATIYHTANDDVAQGYIDEIRATLERLKSIDTAQPAPEYPETLPCPVLLEPGLRFGKGVKTSTMLSALVRRAVYESDLAALSPEERAEFQVGIEDVKALIAQPAPVVPDGYVMVPKVATEKMLIAGLEEADPLGSLIDWNASRGDCNTREQVQGMFEAMLAAAPQSPGSEPATVPGKWTPVSERMPDCWCCTCRPVVLNDMRFVVCPDCGNKRCPRANDHRNACTGSNEPGQEGSAYPAAPQEVKGE